MGFRLLTRDQFREKVFARDRHRCVVCSTPAVDAHHVYDRKLWGKTGGYFLENGVSLCAPHHLDAERSILSCETLRKLAGIVRFPLPESFSPGVTYDKWGTALT